MSTTALRSRTRLVGVLAAALALGGLVGLAPTATAAQTGTLVADSGVATWGVSNYLNSSNAGRPNPKGQFYVAPAEFIPGVPANGDIPAVLALSKWKNGNATVNPDGSATVSFHGTSVNWATTGNAWLALGDLQATFDATGDGSVSALVSYGNTPGSVEGDTSEAARWAARTTVKAAERVTIVDLSDDPENGDATYPASLSGLTYNHSESASGHTWSGLIGRWSTAFQTYLAGNSAVVPAPFGCEATTTCWPYAATVVNTVASSVVRYPAEFKFAIDKTVAKTVPSAVLDEDGIKVTVAGTGFKKTAPGIYVSLRERTEGDAPYAGESLPMDAPTAWVSNNAADIGTNPTTQANAAIAEDGSFSVPVRITPAQIAGLDASKDYTIITRKAHGQGQVPSNADQITETPVDLAAVIAAGKARKTTETTATAAPVKLSTPATVNVTVLAGSGTPAGQVVIKNGTTTVGTGNLGAAGTVAIQVPSPAVGTKQYAVQYAGSDGFWKSAGTVGVTVTKGSTTTGVTITRKATSKIPGQIGVAVKAVTAGTVPAGKVDVILVNGKTVKGFRGLTISATGKVLVTLPTTGKATWTLKVTYLGSANHLGSTKSTTFKVTS